MAYLSAVVLAAVFVRAGAAKLAHPAATATSLKAFGIPASRLVARLLPLAELSLAVALLSVPRAGGAVALALLAGFAAMIATRIRAGVAPPCACFGAAVAAPVSLVELVRNGMLALLAAGALLASEPAWPSPASVIVVAAAVVAGVMLLRAMRRGQARRAARRQAN